jgi:WD40 repeat protein
MDTMEADSATLYSLLARHWNVGVAVERLSFDAAETVVAFALADGRLALAPVEDAEPPKERYRRALDDGRATISPRSRPVPPVAQVVIDGGPVHLAPFGPAGFIAGGRSGHLVRVYKSGTTEPLAEIGSGPIDAIVPTPEAGALVAAGGMLVSYDSRAGTARALSRFDGHVSALAVSPDGHHFAIGADGGLTVRSFGSDAATISTFEVGTVLALSWSPDGRWLAASVEDVGVELVRLNDGRCFRIPDYPTPVLSLAWSPDSRHLVTSGAFRIIAWEIATFSGGPDRPASLETGHAGLVPVEVLGLHPSRPLAAVGYRNGMVVVAQIGKRDELIVKAPGEGAPRAMRWSSDGQHLAFATGDGEAAIVTFPPDLFK